jgi:hypothetical protein
VSLYISVAYFFRLFFIPDIFPLLVSPHTSQLSNSHLKPNCNFPLVHILTIPFPTVFRTPVWKLISIFSYVLHTSPSVCIITPSINYLLYKFYISHFPLTNCVLTQLLQFSSHNFHPASSFNTRSRILSLHLCHYSVSSLLFLTNTVQYRSRIAVCQTSSLVFLTFTSSSQWFSCLPESRYFLILLL